MRYLLFFLWMAVAGTVCAQVRTGAERMDQYLGPLQGKRVALVVNHTSLVGHTHLADTLLSLGVRLSALFAPEHGIRGNADAGETVANGRDMRTGLPVYSLYGKNKKPTADQLAKTDVVLFDIQDVGARFYTYISTLYYVMQACAQHGKPLIVLDRPNPCDHIAGPVLERACQSFVGMYPIPVLHGCTIGELALMANGERWFGTHSRCELSVVPVEGWRHGQPYHLPVKPSPNLPDDFSIACYASLCPFEGTSVSVGRGTERPFHIIGSPLIKELSAGLASRLGMDTVLFVPQPLAGWDKNPLHKGRTCYGIALTEGSIPSGGFTLRYVDLFFRLYRKAGRAGEFFLSPQMFDRLMGTPEVRKSVIAGISYTEIEASWKPALDAYRTLRSQYLLYPDYR